MLNWIIANLATIIICAILVVVVSLVVIKMIRDKKQGKGSCSCGCSGCAMSDTCHGKNK